MTTALVLCAGFLFGVLAHLSGWRRGYADALAARHASASASARFGARTRAANRLASAARALDEGTAPIQGNITNGAEGPE